MDVTIDPRAYKVSKIHPTVIAKVAGILQEKYRHGKPTRKAKRRWQEIVDMNGERFAVNCKDEYGIIVIMGLRYTKKKRGQPWRVD